MVWVGERGARGRGRRQGFESRKVERDWGGSSDRAALILAECVGPAANWAAAVLESIIGCGHGGRGDGGSKWARCPGSCDGGVMRGRGDGGSKWARCPGSWRRR